MLDEIIKYVSLCAAAFAAGVLNSLAGGGTLLTFPTLIAALAGNPAAEVLANTTSTVALVPGSMAGGVMEYVSLVTGYRTLLLMVAALYAAALVARRMAVTVKNV